MRAKNDSTRFDLLSAGLEGLTMPAVSGRSTESEVRSESTRWRWAMFAWEVMHPTADAEPVVITVEDEVLVVYNMLDTAA